MSDKILNIVHNNIDKAIHETSPFDHWVYNKVLPKKIADTLSNLNIIPSSITHHNGKRETYNSTRVFFNNQNCQKTPIFHDIANIFLDHWHNNLLQQLVLNLDHLMENL